MFKYYRLPDKEIRAERGYMVTVSIYISLVSLPLNVFYIISTKYCLLDSQVVLASSAGDPGFNHIFQSNLSGMLKAEYIVYLYMYINTSCIC